MSTANTTASTEPAQNIGPRNFRHAPDLENFYRFVYDNKLRDEARLCFEFILSKIKKPKRTRRKSH